MGTASNGSVKDAGIGGEGSGGASAQSRGWSETDRTGPRALWTADHFSTRALASLCRRFARLSMRAMCTLSFEAFIVLPVPD